MILCTLTLESRWVSSLLEESVAGNSNENAMSSSAQAEAVWHGNGDRVCRGAGNVGLEKKPFRLALEFNLNAAMFVAGRRALLRYVRWPAPGPPVPRAPRPLGPTREKC